MLIRNTYCIRQQLPITSGLLPDIVGCNGGLPPEADPPLAEKPNSRTKSGTADLKPHSAGHNMTNNRPKGYKLFDIYTIF